MTTTTKTRVYLADLRHNFGGVLSTDCMPLSVGYMKAVMDRDLDASEVETRIFAYPDKLLAAIEQAPPDVLMVSNYVWNEALSLFFCRRLKARNAAALTVVGGPNIWVEPERQVQYLSIHPEVDVYVLGEGDFLARDIVKHFMAAGRSLEKFGAREIPSCIYRRPDGRVIRNEQWGRHEGVDEIPSPWLTGIMDEFFDGALAPIIETNRGCPFRCSFCVQGTTYYNKITNFGMDRLKEEIDYIGRRIKEKSPQVGTLRIADANYGMYERDTEISSYIGEAQKKYGWPTFIDATTGKNRPDRIIQSMEKVYGALVLYQAVQSLDEEVLRKVRRSNIKLSTYEQIQVQMRGRGLRSNSDLILGLPGESLKTHIDALHKLIDAGTHQAHCFQAMMLKGADMEALSSREEFKFSTRFRVLPKNFGEYGGEKVFDIEEIIVATDTLPFEDYIQCRKHHVTFSVFWNDSWFKDAVDLAATFGVTPSQWLTAALNAMEVDTGAVREFLLDFVNETINELFPTRDACEQFYARDDNFDKLCRGQIGDNLMYKYRAKASFFIWKQICAAGMNATKQILLGRGAAGEIEGFDALWNDFHAYVEAKHASGSTFEEISAPVELTMRHDIQGWIEAGMPRDLRGFVHAMPRRYVFKLTDEGARELEAALKVWSSRLIGLSKLVTRIRVTSQVRTCGPAVGATAHELVAARE
jgi:radical SAM superfamily enzyme YgiQ (UPF0313 family)